jgi:hypothetical protein
VKKKNLHKKKARHRCLHELTFVVVVVLIALAKHAVTWLPCRAINLRQ